MSNENTVCGGYEVVHPVTMEPLTDEVFASFDAAQEAIESGSLDYDEMTYQVVKRIKT